jgi:hypothetical protein
MNSSRPSCKDLFRGTLFTDYNAGLFKSYNDIKSWFNKCLLVYQESGPVLLTQLSFSGHFDILVMCYIDIAAQNLILDGQGKVWLLN